MPLVSFSSEEPVVKYSPDQPRDKGGKFAGNATSVAAPKHEGHWDTRFKVDPKDVIDVTDATKGAKLLADGKFITTDVKTATNILREAAKNKTDSDITNIEIKNTPLMTQNNVGIPRKMMPQVEPENKDKWLADTRKQGVKVTEGETDPAKLKPIQSEISAAKVGGIMSAIESGKMDLDSGKLADRIIISKDGYVVDGHHRWAAAAFVSLNTEGGVKIPTLTIDLDYKDSLEQVLDWNKANGVKLQDLSGKTQKAIMINEENSIPSILLNVGDGVMKYRAGQARNRMGQFASEGGGGGGSISAGENSGWHMQGETGYSQSSIGSQVDAANANLDKYSGSLAIAKETTGIDGKPAVIRATVFADSYKDPNKFSVSSDNQGLTPNWRCDNADKTTAIAAAFSVDKVGQSMMNNSSMKGSSFTTINTMSYDKAKGELNFIMERNVFGGVDAPTPLTVKVDAALAEALNK